MIRIGLEQAEQQAPQRIRQALGRGRLAAWNQQGQGIRWRIPSPQMQAGGAQLVAPHGGSHLASTVLFGSRVGRGPLFSPTGVTQHQALAGAHQVLRTQIQHHEILRPARGQLQDLGQGGRVDPGFEGLPLDPGAHQEEAALLFQQLLRKNDPGRPQGAQ